LPLPVHDGPASLIDWLYDGQNGYDVPLASESLVERRQSSPMYGEILPESTATLLDYLDLNRDDVLFDLGSGVGKFILQAALTHSVRRCVGVELVKPRHLISEDVLETARGLGLLQTEDVEFRCWDFMRTELDQATIIYTCSTAFSQELLQKLAARMADLSPNTLFVSLQDLDETPWFVLEDVLQLDMSWAPARDVHIYRHV